MEYFIKVMGLGIGIPLTEIKVEGEPVKLPEREYLSLFVCRMPEISFSSAGQIKVHNNIFTGWRVVEEKTGLTVGHGKSRSGAIRHAYKTLQNYSKGQLEEFIEKEENRKCLSEPMTDI